jgi:hypothetical protein
VKLNEIQVYDFNLKFLLKNIEQFSYNPEFFWSPDLLIENTLNVYEERISYAVKVVPKHSHVFKSRQIIDLENPAAFIEQLTVLVTETRRVRGLFHETMNLKEFPTGSEISIPNS